jgi:hypothetical protein
VRLKRFHLFLLGGLILAIAGPVAFTQGPGGFGGGGFGGFKRPTPEETFKQYSGGKDVIIVSQVQVPERMSRWMTTEQLRERMNTFLQKKGITDGKMTLALYTEYSDDQRRQMMERFQKGGFGQGFGKIGGGPGAPMPIPGKTGAPGSAPADLDAQAKQAFEQLDTNKDGKLSDAEMQAAQRFGMRLYDDRAKYDTDKNGTIDLKEFTVYYKDYLAAQNLVPIQPAAPEEEVKKPVVYKVGNLPPELKTVAPWFEQLDKDKDGQVGLYEWKAGDRSIREFEKYDLNRDGFITVEEVLRVHKLTSRKDDKKGGTGLAGAGAVRGFPAGSFNPQQGGFPGGFPNFGRGQRGPGGGGNRMRGPGGGGGRGQRGPGGPGGGGRGGRFRGGNWGGIGGN